jgi:hypothetical protein
MKKIILLFLLPLSLSGQDIQYRYTAWDAGFSYPGFTASELAEPFVILKDQRAAEYIFDESKELQKFESIHKRVLVNSDNAVNQFNKYRISLTNTKRLVEFRARTIKPDGTVIEVQESDMKSIEDYDEFGPYKIFTFEGVEKGDVVELFYTLEKEIQLYGRYTLQTSGIVKEARLEIISPSNLLFAAKGYNIDFQITDTVIEDKNYIIVVKDSIPALFEEKYANYSANQARVEYIFHENTNLKSTSYHTWASAAQRYYEVIYTTDKKVEKTVRKFLAGLHLKDLPEEEKIKTIERYIKTNFEIKSIEGIENGEEIETILENKYSSELGITRLFAILFEVEGIEHQLGITHDKTHQRFDKDFMTWNYLTCYLFYFPGSDKFLSPASFEYRYGTVPGINSSVYGMFVKKVQIGDFVTGIPVFRFIPPLSYKDNITNLELEVTFPDDISYATVDMKHIYGGEAAIPLKPYFEFLPERDKETLTDQFIKAIGEDVEILEKTVYNTNLDTSAVEKPLTVAARLIYRSAVEKAGENYIFNIGKLIGEQVELYQKHTRQQEIDIEFAHELERKIQFTIPQGYDVKGLENLNINIEYSTDNEKSMGFLSNFTVDGDTVNVHIYEYYTRTTYPLEQYEEFREVINAAADFNKISLLFEKVN